jgi:hypothetical protein
MKSVMPALLFGLLIAASAAAQGTPPPIQGVTGTIATDGSIDGVHKAAGAVAGAVKNILPGSKDADQDPLTTLIEGSRVVVQEPAAAATPAAEGVVIDVNKKRQQITVRFADKKTQTLRVLDHKGGTQGAHVVVSLADQPGEKITYDFTRVS